MAMARCHKAAERDPADHCHKNEPKLRVNSGIDSHIILHGRPLGCQISAVQKAPGNPLDAMSQRRPGCLGTIALLFFGRGRNGNALPIFQKSPWIVGALFSTAILYLFFAGLMGVAANLNWL